MKPLSNLQGGVLAIALIALGTAGILDLIPEPLVLLSILLCVIGSAIMIFSPDNDTSPGE